MEHHAAILHTSWGILELQFTKKNLKSQDIGHSLLRRIRNLKTSDPRGQFINITKLQTIPTRHQQDTWQMRLEHLARMTIQTPLIGMGHLDLSSINRLLKIHAMKDAKKAVVQEMSRLNKPLGSKSSPWSLMGVQEGGGGLGYGKCLVNPQNLIFYPFKIGF